MQKLTTDKSYEEYRWFFTSSGILVVGGKSDLQNEKVLNEFSSPNYIVTHTNEPGSPFMIIVSNKPDTKDIEEIAIFCACFSKQWKLKQSKIEIDIFSRSQVYKIKKMKTGTFGVKDTVKKISVKPELVLVIQKGKLRSVPKTTKEEKIASLTPGNLNKEQATEKISKIIKDNYHFPISKDEIRSAIPSDKLEVQ